MEIKIEHVEKSIERFANVTRILAAKASNLPEEELVYFPSIITKPDSIWAYTLCSEGPNSDFYDAYIVNASLCLEMLLKAVLYYERDIWIRGHDLGKLYEQISAPNKKKINTAYKKLYKDSAWSKPIAKQIKEETGLDIKWNPASLLALSYKAFEHWRYAFDIKGTRSCFLGYSEIFPALDSLRVELKANK
ncbi:hypothetical protein CXF72_00920 [Psychromonas sp. MB-3u-54]|uniref:hypothetical protein n=1 Tax=Psychromonas sp. MB-3u-54 TaxID=2058319 RepID=UPI000C332DC7|nr:hypothetical protein [Psychromonas sp. MB-3u-54]PKH04473.1 hypothetical protein CXF72_00920 [Psychromonas sp. MB-3u-54]